MGVDVKYRTYDVLNEEKTKVETKFDVKYTKMIEYEPNDENPENGYFLGDQIVQNISLSNFAEFQASPSNAEDGKMTYTVTTADKTASFRFTVDTAVKPTGFSANTMKIDVDIVGFPWKQDNTFLALLSTVRSEKKVKTNSKYVNKKGKPKGVIDGNKDEIAQGYVEESRPETESMFDIDFGTSTSDGYTPFGKYEIVNQAEITVAEPTRSRILNDNVVTKENMDASNEMSKENMAEGATTEDMTKENFANGSTGGDITDVPVVKKQIFVKATELGLTEGGAADQNKIIAFSFINSNQAQEIYWDPEIGVGYASSATSNFGSSGSGGDWLSTSVGFVKQKWWFVMTIMVGVVGNLLL